MTDELFSQYTYYKIQYGAQNVATGKVVVRSLGHFAILRKEVLWYRKPDSQLRWYCDISQIDYDDRRFPNYLDWWIEDHLVHVADVGGSFSALDKLHRTVYLPSISTNAPFGWNPGVEKVIWW